LAQNNIFSEERALQLLEDGAEAGANFLCLAQCITTTNSIHQRMVPVRASLHAAVNGYPRLTHALLKREKAAESEQRDTHVQALAKVVSSIDFRMQTFDQASVRDHLAEIKKIQHTIGGLILDKGLVDIDSDFASSQLLSSLEELSSVSNDIENLLAETCATEGRESDQEIDLAVQNTSANGMAVNRHGLRKWKAVADIRAAIASSVRAVAVEAQQLMDICTNRPVGHPAGAEPNKWIDAENFFNRQRVEHIRGLTYLSMTNQVAAIKIVLAAPTPVEPHDVSSAYAWSLVLRKSRNEADKKIGQAMTEAFHTTAMTDLSLWGMLHAALELKEFTDVVGTAKQAQARRVNLDLLQGPYASHVVRNAALASHASFKAVLSCLADEGSQQRLFEVADGAGDTLYHIVARCEGRILETFSKKTGFRAAALTDCRNVSGLNAFDEACRVASPSTLSFLWRKSVNWRLTEQFDSALVEAARNGMVAGALAIATSAQREQRVVRLLQTSLAALDGVNFPEQRQQVVDLLSSWDGAKREIEAETLALGQAGKLTATQVERKFSSSGQTLSALRQQYDLLRQSHAPSKVEEGLARFDAVYRASSGTQSASEEDREICKEVIYNLEQRFFGRYFGRHFFAHRASVGDGQLSQRLTRLQNYGSSRFGYEDAPAILRIRQRAMKAARHYEQSKKNAGEVSVGLFAIHLSDLGVNGSGFTLMGPENKVAAFLDSTTVRVLLRLSPNGDIPQVVSMYPVPTRGPNDRYLETFTAVTA
jgi:hypothetical protein